MLILTPLFDIYVLNGTSQKRQDQSKPSICRMAPSGTTEKDPNLYSSNGPYTKFLQTTITEKYYYMAATFCCKTSPLK